jgi:hypothetical protein
VGRGAERIAGPHLPGWLPGASASASVQRSSSCSTQTGEVHLSGTSCDVPCAPGDRGSGQKSAPTRCKSVPTLIRCFSECAIAVQCAASSRESSLRFTRQKYTAGGYASDWACQRLQVFEGLACPYAHFMSCQCPCPDGMADECKHETGALLTSHGHCEHVSAT